MFLEKVLLELEVPVVFVDPTLSGVGGGGWGG